MSNRLTALERAFEMARSGQYTTVAEIKKQLVAEGFSIAQVTGGALSRQLKDLIRAAQEARAV
jgi:arginine repressor